MTVVLEKDKEHIRAIQLEIIIRMLEADKTLKNILRIYLK
jgi:hypothetical protein